MGEPMKHLEPYATAKCDELSERETISMAAEPGAACYYPL